MSSKKNNEKPKLDAIDKIIDNTFNRIKDIVDANTVIGSTIEITKNIFLIPISKISVGLISGGGEMPMKNKNFATNGASTTGFTVTPLGFVTINNGIIDFVSLGETDNTAGKILETVVGIYEKFLLKNGENNEE